ncbi:MAG TPA: glycosyltransferase [Thermoanaerobaculia bacterium]|nr:glycosyltransferase [Thermoanaerobaculia bacterium]
MISLLLVNYRAAALAADAVRTARASAAAPLQIVIVDNSCDPAEAESLRGLADTLIVSTTNRGYAGGINDGRRACEGSTIVVSNPDVTFAPHALDQLAGALDGRTAVAGPALFWDDAHAWRLPPADLTTTAEKLDEVLATRARSWFEQRDRRRIRARIAFWSLDRTTEVRALSGAVMAIRAQDFDDAGGFDERFRLYFEEIDFLRRIAARRRRIVYVPAARCRHLFNQSAARDAAAASVLYVESELRYLEKWSGPFAARALKRLERAPYVFDALPSAAPIAIPRGTAVVEVSPLPSFVTAAGHVPTSERIDLPPEVWRSVGAQPLYLRLIDGEQNVVNSFRLQAALESST